MGKKAKNPAQKKVKDPAQKKAARLAAFPFVAALGIRQADAARLTASADRTLVTTSFSMSPRCRAFLNTLSSLSGETASAILERAVRVLAWYELHAEDEHFEVLFNRLMARELGEGWAHAEGCDLRDFDRSIEIAGRRFVPLAGHVEQPEKGSKAEPKDAGAK